MGNDIKTRRYVPADGKTYSNNIIFVGEAPGGEEEAHGVPFIGPAGAEFNRMLSDAKIMRTESYVTNVFKVRPNDNDIGEFITYKAKQPPGWISHHGAWVHPEVYPHIMELKKEIELLKPNVVVPLGGTALWAITGELGITKWRGSIMESRLVPGVKCIPTLHPASILRQWSGRCDAVQDLRRVRREHLSPNIIQPTWRFHIRPTLMDVSRCLHEAESSRLLSVDIETAKAKDVRLISCIGIAWSTGDAICIPFENRDGSSYWSPEEEEIIMSEILKLLKTTPFVGQNFLYDAYYFWMFHGVRLRPILDTLMGFHFLFPGKPKALYEQASLLCDYYRYWKDEGKITDWRHGSEEQIWVYNCQDCVYTLEVAHRQKELIAHRDPKLWTFMMKRWDSAFELMCRGIRRDNTKREAARDKLTQVKEECKRGLDYILREDFNPQSSPQMKWLAYELFKLPVVTDRKTREASVNDAAMDQLEASEPLIRPIFNLVRRYRTANVLLSNFINTDGPVNRAYTSFNPMGPETFRWSSSKNPLGWGSNLQNIMRDDTEPNPALRLPSMRDMFIPDEGYFLFEIDLKSADLQVVIWEADDAELKLALRNGKDIYTDCALDAGIRLPRQLGKTFIHLTDYGGTARTAAIACKLKVAEAEAMQRLWLNRHPGIREWHRRTEDQLAANRTIRNAFGLQITYFDRPDSVLKEALAWVPQSTVANITDFAIINIREIMPYVQVLLNGHDSIVGQIPLAERYRAGPVLKLVTQILVPYKDPLVIPWDLKIGDVSWGAAKRGCWKCLQTKENCTCEIVQVPNRTIYPAAHAGD